MIYFLRVRFRDCGIPLGGSLISHFAILLPWLSGARLQGFKMGLLSKSEVKTYIPVKLLLQGFQKFLSHVILSE